jgi:hypothetical protein
MPTRRDFIKSTTLAAGVSAVVGVENKVSAKPGHSVTKNTFRKKLLEGLGGPWPEGDDLKPK